MAYQKLNELLISLGEENIDVKRAYVLKVGCVRVSTVQHPTEQSRYPVSEMEKILENQKELQSDQLDNYYKNVIEALKKSPNIFDFSEDSAYGSLKLQLSVATGEGIILVGKLLKMRVDLPDRLQKYREDYPLSEKPVEQFQIITSGSIFIAYSQIKDAPVWTNIGHEFRELLTSQIEKETTLSAPLFGPSPIHPDIYLVIRDRSGKSLFTNFKTYEHNDNLFVIIDDLGNKDENVIEVLYHEIQQNIRSFYFSQIKRIMSMNFYAEILNLFEDLSQAVTKKHETAWWKVFKLNHLMSKARMSLSKIHSRYIDFELLTFDFTRERKELFDQLAENRILKPIIKYFQDITEPDYSIPQSLSKALEHFEAEVQLFKNTQSVVLTSIISAILASLLTAFLTK